jgi:beta-glucosidase
VVENPGQADLAIVRAVTPSDKLHPYHFFGSRQNEGRLDFRDGDPAYEAIKAAASAVPTIVAVNMDRPAILTNIRDKAAALIVTFGASDAALLDVVTGKAVARGRLPFELPSSMAAVAAQDPAVPDDSAQPLYPRGAGIQLGAAR